MFTKKWISCIMVIILLLSFGACSNEPKIADKSEFNDFKVDVSEPLITDGTIDLMKNIQATAPTGYAVDDKFIKSTANMSIELFQKSLDQDKNSLISPLSVMVALAMTANGADGETLSQMEEALGGLDINELNEYLYTYINMLPNEEKAKFAVANSIWLDKSRVNVFDDFLETNAEYYNAAAYSVNFADKASVNDINNWVKANTWVMIDKLIDDLSDDLVMCLINAVAFDAEWERKFDSELTTQDIFTTLDGTEKTVDMMHQNSKMKYIEVKDSIGIIKNYSGGKYSFVAMLPDETIDIYEFIDSLDGEAFVNAIKAAEEDEVVLSLPKFSYEYEVTLNKPLQEMGMEDAFYNANFSKISDSPILISYVLHKTYIEVTDKGTKAAAVTGVFLEYTAVTKPKIINVTLDRPFVYAIIDNSTNLPIFLGTVIDF